MRRGEIPGIALDKRPYATVAIIVLSLASTLAYRSGQVNVLDLGAIYGPLGSDWWRVLAAPFIHDNAGYQFITLVAVGVFGTALERHFGSYVTALIFLAAGAAGCGLAVAAQDYPVLGANGAALGLLAAWFIEFRMTRPDDGDVDLLGAGMFAAVLFGLSVAWQPASIVAGVGGALVGCVAGFALAQRSR